jgi:hypothetical protein
VKSVDELSSIELQKCLSAQVLISKNIDIDFVKFKHRRQLNITNNMDVTFVEQSFLNVVI